MGAPKGNKFWQLRSKHGRDKLFESPEALWEAACEYFTWCEKHPWYKTEQLKKPYTFTNEKGKIVLVSTTQLPIARPYTIQGLCRYLDCNSVWFNQFEYGLKEKTDEVSLGFSKIVSRIREIIFQQKFEGAAVGAYNANLIARELGMADKKENRFVDKNGDDIPTDQVPQILIIQSPGETIEIKESEE